MLDLDKDPTPGDPHRVRQLARTLHDFADDVADALRLIKGMAQENETPGVGGEDRRCVPGRVLGRAEEPEEAEEVVRPVRRRAGGLLAEVGA
ncbi:hypothetical protein RB628_36510, partial [Streptomyces sp. ADMS]|nr:hypothetical protein [Streptomyces sp. ADMS]